MVRLLLIGLAALAGCYAPELTDCRVRCGPGDSCPAELACRDGFCVHPGLDGGCSAPCAVDCTPGAARCGDGGVERCAEAGDCPTWSAESACTGATPVCVASLARCGCDDRACAASHQDCDGMSGACVTCAPSPMPESRADFYVDPTTTGLVTGSLGCPYRTITAALIAARQSSAANKTIHLAAGTYDQETLPLVLRGGISVVGPGRDRTLIAGVGQFDHQAQGGFAAGSDYLVTVVIGDDSGLERLAGVRLESRVTATAGVIGVFCDQGTTTQLGSSPPPANVVLDNVEVHSSYDKGVLVTNSTSSGCNLALTDTIVYDALVGVELAGCDAAGVGKPVAARLGDGTAAGTCNFGGSQRSLHMGDCVAALELQRDTFAFPVQLSPHQAESLIVVEDSAFNGGDFGLLVENQALVARLRGCQFGLANFGSALWIRDDARIALARQNQLYANRTGLRIDGSPVTAAREMDFGRVEDPGGNIFRCNSANVSSPDTGYDVVLAVAAGSTEALRFDGNAWDHAPPSASTSATAPNGTDLVSLSAAPAPAVTTDGATVSTLPCPPQLDP